MVREAEIAQLTMVEVVTDRHGDPGVGHIGRVGLCLVNLLGKQRLVDGAVVHVLQRHPSAGQHSVQLDDPADEVRVGLLPKGFFALAEQLIQEGRHRVGERVRIERCFRHQLLLPRPYLVLTKPLRLDIQCQRGASVKIGWKYLDD